MNSDENGYKWKLSNIIKSIATVAIIASVVVAACVVGGPVLIGAAIGVVVGTAVGGAIGYNANGLDGAINGALIGAAVGAAVGAIAGYAYQFFSAAGKVATDSITVGKGMGRVGQAATELGSSQYGGMPGYKLIGKLFPKLGEIHNKMWLAKNIAAGKTVFDIGWGLSNVDPECSYYRETEWMIEFVEKGIEFVRQVISGF
ncbi:MAG: hypothetical protein JXL85_07945 [Bacilli bacterium]|nr:hypothetical protein [Bacilli bacterium]